MLYNDVSAFQMNLAAIPALATLNFETKPNASKFCAYERYNSFIEGSESQTALSDEPAAMQALRSQDAARRDALEAGRRVLRSR